MEPPILHIRLFGSLELRYGQQLIPPFESSRAESLLAYLLLHRESPQPRQRIAFMLWPDSSEGQARTNLRHLLHTLRHALPEPERFLDVTQRTLQWRVAAPWQLDVADFEAANERSDLRAAVDLYRGDLLPNCYDEWIVDARENFRQQFLQSLEQLARSLEADGDNLQAIYYAGKLQLHDPLYEETYRLLMRLHDARGDRARAVRVYHECATTLERELGVEPSGPTRAAYMALLAPAPGGNVESRQATGREPVGRTNSPLVGRAREWEALTEVWLAAERGNARFVLISGEAGIGKTKLVEELQAWCAHRGAVMAGARSYAAEGELAYGPIVAWLRSESFRVRFDRLDRTTLADLSQLLPEIRAVDPKLPDARALPESEQRQRLFNALIRAVLATNSPLLLVIDDIQWSDRETLHFLHYLLRAEQQGRFLVAATARREETDERHPLHDLIAGLRALDRLTEIELERLSHQETAEFAGQLVDQSIPKARIAQLFDETEGNPLFIIEVLRAGWLNGHVENNWMTPRVQAVIESRLAHLSEPASELVGLAATIGREFTTDTLGYASDIGEETLVRGLDELWRRRIVREQGADAYDFSHDKIREAAYLALSPVRRRHHHLRVARALEQLHRHDPDPVSGQLASHYERAGQPQTAANWYLRAAAGAQRLHANLEAVRLLERGLALLGTLRETSERQAQELALLTALPAPLVAVEGYLSRRVSEIHERALTLTRMLGVEPEPPLLRSLALAGLSHYDFEAAQQFGEQLRQHGLRESDDVLLVQSGYVLGIAAFWKGELQEAREHFETAVKRCQPEHRRSHFLYYGHDPESACLMRLACTLCFLDDPVGAERARDAALSLTGEIGHPYSRTLTLVFACLLALERGDLVRVREHTTELLSGRTANDPTHIRSTTEVFAGYVDILDGRVENGIARIQIILTDSESSEQAPGQEAFFLRVLLEACLLGGDARTGLAAADRMLRENRGVRLWESEARRHRATFLATLGTSRADIEAELDEALAVARRQGAKLFERRALINLIQFQLSQGDERAAAGAREQLAALDVERRASPGTPAERETTLIYTPD